MSEQHRGRGRPRAAGDLVCDRCGRSTSALPWRWPDGRICRTCYRAAAQTYGTCHGCHAHRLVPGLDCDGNPLCRDCAGITAKLDCTACGAEGLLEKSGLCIRCSLRSDRGRLHSRSDPWGGGATRHSRVCRSRVDSAAR